MKLKITIELDSIWVLDHQEDDTLPIDRLKEYLTKKYKSNICFLDQSFTHITFNVEGEVEKDAIQNNILNYFSTTYQVDDAEKEKILSINLEVDGSPIDNEEDDDDDDEDIDDADKLSLDELLDQLSDIFSDDEDKEDDDLFDDEDKIEDKKEVNINSEENTESPTSPKKSAIELTMEEIDRLVGAGEFKALCKEIVTISPQIKENKNFDTFLSRSYLFSINSGYGLTTALHTLANLINNCGLAKFAKRRIVIETDVDNALSKLEWLDVDEYRIFAIDISEKMSSLNDPSFKKLLNLLACNSDKAIFVFVIPFVDKEVLKNTCYAINDVLFVKEVSFSPLTKKEMETFAIKEIEKRHFTISKNALDAFHARINEEKSDGRFYGLKTITKVVNELIYTKQLTNALSKKPNCIISKKDANNICHSNLNDLTGYELLEKLVASDKLKEKIDEIISQIMLIKQDKSIKAPCIHMQFVGNPGTGKTTVARIIGKILKEKGVLRVGSFHEYAGRDLCGKYIGETAPKTASICRDAYGSILFIDEAYSLYRTEDAGRDYGREALDTLIAEMENHRTDLVVILAGYNDEMGLLMKGNAGLSSRIPYKIEFPNFTREQLAEIFENMVKDSFKYDNDLLVASKKYFTELSEEFITSKEFSNARFVRNLFERTWAKASLRCQLSGLTTITLTGADFEIAIMDNEFKKTEPKRRKIGFN